MAFPIVYPAVDGPGRLTEICTFRKANISDEEFNAVYSEITKEAANFPISRQGILGVRTDDRQIAAMIADWTSAAQKDVFEPGEQYQSVKPHFEKIIDNENPTFACHHIILPGAAMTTACPHYIVSHLTIPKNDQSAAATAFAALVVSQSAAGLDFLAVAPSREDADVVVCITGHKDEAAAKHFENSDAYKQLQSSLRKLASSNSSYTVEKQTASVY